MPEQIYNEESAEVNVDLGNKQKEGISWTIKTSDKAIKQGTLPQTDKITVVEDPPRYNYKKEKMRKEK